MNSFIIENSKIITTSGVIENGFIYIRKGIICDIKRAAPSNFHRSCRIIDGKGCWLLPGIIDLFSSDLAGCINNGSIVAEHFFKTELQLLKSGITSVYYSLPSEMSSPELNHIVHENFNRLKKLGIIRHKLISAITPEDYFIYVNSESAVAVMELSSPGFAPVKSWAGTILEDIAAKHNRYVLCGNIAASEMLEFVFLLHGKYGLELSEAASILTLNPAEAVGVERRLGSLECGKAADMVLVCLINGKPTVDKVFVNGCAVYELTQC
ncbi:MAG: amidohydrolase family protein [Clostridiales bacterium]|nr:amidohydrolase family protein [Clostridiales bacterium]